MLANQHPEEPVRARAFGLQQLWRKWLFTSPLRLDVYARLAACQFLSEHSRQLSIYPQMNVHRSQRPRETAETGQGHPCVVHHLENRAPRGSFRTITLSANGSTAEFPLSKTCHQDHQQL